MSIFNFKNENKSKDSSKKDDTTKPDDAIKTNDTKKKEQKSDKKEEMKELYSDKDTKTTKVDANKSGNYTSNAYRILVKPLITEKASAMGALNKYTFAVDVNANKIEIAKAIKDVYNVNPEKVNIIKMKGKKVVRGGRTGRRKNWKKAIITLSKGQSIQVYEGL